MQSPAGARRLRAGWEYYAVHRPDVPVNLQISAVSILQARSGNITPYDVDAKPDGDCLGLHTVVCEVAFSPCVDVWFGDMERHCRELCALQGQWSPQQADETGHHRAFRHRYHQGAFRSGLFPLWWAAGSLFATWSLLNASSGQRHLAVIG